MTCLSRRDVLGSIALGALRGAAYSQSATAAQLTRAEKVAFLDSAKVVGFKGAPRGITGTLRLTLDNGHLKHDASFQCIDEFKSTFQTDRGTEMNFRDCWQFNLAAYRLDEMLGLYMVPVTVERRYRGKQGSFTWWVDDVLMTEFDRFKKKIEPPAQGPWTQQMQIVRVFDQLIYNTDRNLGNLVIDKSWLIWMIDHTRAFRIRQDLLDPKVLSRCDGELLEKMKRLDNAALKELSRYIGSFEITGLLKRRDRIVEALEKRGPSALYTSVRRPS